jgi:uncharacterized RmlC-like cupin family protein
VKLPTPFTLSRFFSQELNMEANLSSSVTSNSSNLENNSDGIGIVTPEEFDRTTAQTPGSKRLAAIAGTSSSNSQMWGGLFFVEPKSQTAIHHHGRQETIVYVLEGQALIRWGEHGEFEAMANRGDFIHVPPFLPHRETNPSDSVTFSWVVVRSTPEPIVVNLPGDYWD